MLSIFILFIFIGVYCSYNFVKCFYAETIIGGDLARIHEFKYQVSIQVFDQHMCGGGILSNRYIITAAHCFTDEETGEFVDYNFTIAADTIDVTVKAPVRIPVEKVYIPLNYHPCNATNFMRFDIAVAKLLKSLQLEKNNYLRQLRLPPPFFSHLRKNFVFAGYGFNQLTFICNEESSVGMEVGSSDGKLRHANAQSISNKHCATITGIFIDTSTLCAKLIQRNKTSFEGTCAGDSGSPLVYNDMVVGILFGSRLGCSEETIPALYTRVTHFRNFILNALKDRKTSDMRSMGFINNLQKRIKVSEE